MTMIPVVNFLAMPASVAGATAMWVGSSSKAARGYLHDYIHRRDAENAEEFLLLKPMQNSCDSRSLLQYYVAIMSTIEYHSGFGMHVNARMKFVI